MAKQTLLQMPKPCSQNWEEMSIVPGGRFCDNCAKKVIDFSLMNDRQILEIFNKNKGGVCGRFVNEQLNRELAVGSQQSNALIPAVLISTALMVGTGVHAAEKKVTAIEQDTVKPELDSMRYLKDQTPLGYSALANELVVTGDAVRRSNTVGGAIAVVQITTLPRKRNRWWQFWR
jgi:hypothetical protein